MSASHRSEKKSHSAEHPTKGKRQTLTDSASFQKPSSTSDIQSQPQGSEAKAPPSENGEEEDIDVEGALKHIKTSAA